MSQPGSLIPAFRSWRPLGPRAAFALKVSLLMSFLGASSAPTPLYALYRDAWHFSAFALTAAFASYAFALLAALLVFGKLSDHLGRRPVILLAIALEAASMLLFLRAGDVQALAGARALQGLATGIATAVLSAGLLDLHPQRGALWNGIGPLLGMALGLLGASALVQFAPGSRGLVFELLLAVFAVQWAVGLWLPETAVPRPGVLASMRPRVAVPAPAREALWRVLPVNTALWALGGFYLSLGPTLVRQITGSALPLAGAALPATLVLSAAVSVAAVRARPAWGVVAAGAATLAGGLLLTLAGVFAHAGTPFFAGTVLAGAGFGASFNGAVRVLVPLAPAQERAGLMAGFFVASYLAFSVPALCAGLLVGAAGLERTAVGYGGLLVLLAGAAWWGARGRARAAR